MSACSRCGAGAWHPEVALCTHTDCEMTAARVDLRQQPANDRQPDGLRREVERVPVHAGSIAR